MQGVGKLTSFETTITGKSSSGTFVTLACFISFCITITKFLTNPVTIWLRSGYVAFLFEEVSICHTFIQFLVIIRY